MDLHTELVNDPRFKEAFDGVTIFGIAGSNASGKDTVLDMLVEHGYFISNAGDNVRQITRAVMGTTQRGGNQSPAGIVANAQRSVYPGGMVSVGLIDYWTRVLHMPKDQQPKGLAIGSIRGVGEAETLKNFGGKLIVIDADPEVRYQRIISRKRDYESNISFEQFLAEEAAEMAVKETDPTKFGMAQVMKMADITIYNKYDSINEFKTAVLQALGLSSSDKKA